jgi:hypothetical protein
MIRLSLCHTHQEQLQISEPLAWRCWSDLMRRGLGAYAECRFESAEICLTHALDVVLFRMQQPQNQIFSEIHFIKTLEFLMELLRTDLRFNEAKKLLKRLSDTLCENCSQPKVSLLEFMTHCFVTVEQAQICYLTENRVAATRRANYNPGTQGRSVH